MSHVRPYRVQIVSSTGSRHRLISLKDVTRPTNSATDQTSSVHNISQNQTVEIIKPSCVIMYSTPA